MAIAQPPRLPEAVSLRRVLGGARLAIALALLAAIGLNGWLTWHAADMTAGLQEREFEIVRSARTLQGKVPALISNGRGYLLTREPIFLEDLAREQADAEAALDSLSGLISTSEGRALLDRIGAGLQGVIAGVERRNQLAREGRLDEARAELVLAHRQQVELLGLLDTLVEREEALLRARLEETQQERLLGLVVSTFILVGIGMVAAALLTRSQRALEHSQQRLQGAAEELASINAVLIQANLALRETAEARDQALTDLQEAARQRADFITSVSHDLQNPLASIKAQAQLLERRLQRDAVDAPSALGTGLAQISATATKMSVLINELLDVARLQVGQPLELNRRQVDLVALTEQALAEHERATDQHRLRLVTDGEPVVGEWDGPRLERVLANLLSNAIKYSPAGGEITVTVRREPHDGSDEAVLAVRDQGVGIPAADLPRIFEHFHRGGNVAGRIKGTGIGLAGARHIVERHGGSLTVESCESAGSTFTVRLPFTAGGASSGADPDGSADEERSAGQAPGVAAP